LRRRGKGEEMGTPGSILTKPNPNPKPGLTNLGDSLNRVFLLALRQPTIQQPTSVTDAEKRRKSTEKRRED
jgi:hypothetical protein